MPISERRFVMRRLGRTARRPRWMTSFADTMLLLFTFFVLLFSMSVIDKHKYGQMRGALEMAFSGGQSSDTGEMSDFPQVVSQEFQAVPLSVQTGIEKNMGKEIQAKDVEVEHDASGLTLLVTGAIAFDKGSVKIREDFKDFLKRFSEAVLKEDVFVSVEGNIDSQPLRPDTAYSSNWDFSARRAVSVVEYLNGRLGIPAERLAAVGHGDAHRGAAKKTGESDERSRRITFRLRPLHEEGE